MKTFSFKNLLMLVGVAVVVGGGYLYLQESTLLIGDSSTEAYAGQSLPPILFLEVKTSADKGCYDVKWSSMNVNSCTSSWRSNVSTNGNEQVCQGKKNVDGIRNVSPKTGDVLYTVSCTGSAGSVSRSMVVKSN